MAQRMKRDIRQMMRISYINQTDEKATGTTYKAYINFEPDENIRLGMTAIVYAQ